MKRLIEICLQSYLWVSYLFDQPEKFALDFVLPPRQSGKYSKHQGQMIYLRMYTVKITLFSIAVACTITPGYVTARRGLIIRLLQNPWNIIAMERNIRNKCRLFIASTLQKPTSFVMS